MHNQGDIWKLMGKKLSGEADREELRQLQTLLEDNPHLIYSLEVLTKLGQSQTSSNTPTPSNTSNTSKHTHPPQKSGNEFFPGKLMAKSI